ATDNGLKVYWEDGAQIAPPLDAEIAALVDASFDDTLPPFVAEPGPVEEIDRTEPYLRHVAELVAGSPAPPSRVAWTALHGVGGDLFEQALRHVGHTDLHAVVSQRRPDPDFPTVRVPNPEEPGVLDELLALAAIVGADVGLALRSEE